MTETMCVRGVRIQPLHTKSVLFALQCCAYNTIGTAAVAAARRRRRRWEISHHEHDEDMWQYMLQQQNAGGFYPPILHLHLSLALLLFSDFIYLLVRPSIRCRSVDVFHLQRFDRFDVLAKRLFASRLNNWDDEIYGRAANGCCWFAIPSRCPFWIMTNSPWENLLAISVDCQLICFLLSNSLETKLSASPSPRSKTKKRKMRRVRMQLRSYDIPSSSSSASQTSDDRVGEVIVLVNRIEFAVKRCRSSKKLAKKMFKLVRKHLICCLFPFHFSFNFVLSFM